MKKIRDFLKRFRLPALILAIAMAFPLVGCRPAQSAEDVGAEVANDLGLARASAYLVVKVASETLYAFTTNVTTREEAIKIAMTEDLAFNSLASAKIALEKADACLKEGDFKRAEEYVLLAVNQSDTLFKLIGATPPEEAKNAIKFVKGFIEAK